MIHLVTEVSRNLRGKTIFILLTVSSVNFLLLTNSNWSILWAVWVLIRLSCLRQKELTILCCLSSFFAFSYFKWVQQTESQAIQQAQIGQIKGDFAIVPDESRIEGNYLKLTGISGKKERVVLSYRMKSPEEKTYWSMISRWQRIEITGIAEIPDNQRNLNGFDYRKFLKERKIYRTITIERIQKVVSMETFFLKSPIKKIREWRQKLRLHVNQVFPKYTRMYLKSLLFGMRDEEFQEMSQKWQLLGVIHLLTVSGVYLSVLSEILRFMFLKIGFSQESVFWLEALFFSCFFVLTGLATGIGRGIAQRLLKIVAAKYNWQVTLLDCWSLTLLLFFLISPYVLMSASGQLSFGLTFFLIYIPSSLHQIKNYYLKRIVFSVAITVCSLPFIWGHFYTWNRLSFLISVVLFPIFSQIILPLVIFLLVLSGFYHGLGETLLLAYIEQFFLMLQGIVAKLADLDILQQVTGKLAFWQFLVGLGSLLIFFSYPQNLKTRIVSLVLLFSLSFGKYLNPQGMVAFVDVGQGDSLFIQLPFNQGNYLVDTGGRIPFFVEDWARKRMQITNAERTLLPFLKSRGVTQLNQVFITHGDMDHMGDLLVIDQVIPIQKLTYPEGTDKKSQFRKKVQLLKQKGVVLDPVLSGSVVNFQKGIELEVIYPTKAGKGQNNDSLVLLVTIKRKRFLLTGDLENAEADLVHKNLNLKAEVLKVGHHGSRTSTSALLLEQIQAREAVVSSGRNNRFGHPHQETLERLALFQVEVSQTDLNGMIYYTWNHWGSRLSKQKKIHSN